MNQDVQVAFASAALLQFWDNNASEEIQGLLDSVRDVSPELGYNFFDDESALAFINAEYGSDMKALYESCALPAMRADLFRYCYLALHGGFYVDADYGSLKSLMPLIELNRQGILYEREKGICNSALYFRDGNDPLMALILDSAVANVRARSSNSVWDMTGPAVIQRLHAKPETRPLFDDFYLINEPEFKTYFALADSLPYKSTNVHWFVARNNGLSPFKN